MCGGILKIQKIISVILAIYVTLFCINDISVFAKQETSDTISINYTSTDNLIKSFDFLYDDSFFFSDSYKYNKELSLLSMGFSMAAFTASSFEEVEDCTIKPNSNISDAYRKAGFIEPQYYNYDKPLSDCSDKAAFSIAQKNISLNEKNTILVAVVIRGNGYGAEWASNYHIGDEKYHIGFNTAAEEVYSSVIKYISKFIEKKSIKIWITGYSRGAAIANLTAEKFDRNNEILTNNIFAYTFAAPLCSKDTLGKDNPVYENIFNIINPIDIVTNVPMSDWGYYRYGKNLVLPMLVSGIGFAKESKLKSAVKSKYNKINSLLPFSTNDKYIAEIEKIKYSILNQAENATEYSEKLQQDICSEIAETDDDISAVMIMLQKIASNANYSVNEYADIFSIHYPELYLAWLIAIDDENIFNKYSSFKKLTFTNVDFVDVYSDSGTMCVSIKDGYIKKSLLPTEINEDNSISIYIYGDSKFNLEFGSKTDSISNYIIEEYDKYGSLTRIVKFNNISTKNETILKGSVPYDLYCDKDNYMLSYGNLSIEADYDSGFIEDIVHSIIVSSGTSNVGAAAQGKKVTLTLNLDKDKYIFKGWTSDSKKLQIKFAENETAEFIMPNYAVRVYPIIEEKEITTDYTIYILVACIVAIIIGISIFIFLKRNHNE